MNIVDWGAVWCPATLGLRLQVSLRIVGSKSMLLPLPSSTKHDKNTTENNIDKMVQWYKKNVDFTAAPVFQRIYIDS